jgi:hypothetical protein
MSLYKPGRTSEGVFGGINYRSLYREDGEVSLTIFQKSDGNPPIKLVDPD